MDVNADTYTDKSPGLGVALKPHSALMYYNRIAKALDDHNLGIICNIKRIRTFHIAGLFTGEMHSPFGVRLALGNSADTARTSENLLLLAQTLALA